MKIVLSAALLTIVLLTILLSGCAITPEQKGTKYLKNGKALMDKREYARAILEFKNAIQALPRSAEAYYQLGRCYLLTGDTRSGVAWLQKATEVDPKYVAPQLEIAELQMLSKNPEVLADSRKRIEAVFAESPGNSEVLDAMALSDFISGKSQEAEERLAEAVTEFPNDLKVSRDLAGVKLSRRDFAGAEDVLKQAAARNPKSPEAQNALGRVYLVLGKLPDAEAAFRQALVIDPKNAPALMDLARLQAAAGRAADTEATLAVLSALLGEQYRPLHATFLLNERKYDAAIKEFEQQAAAAPKDRGARTRLIRAYLLANRTDDAARIINAALQKNPKDADSLLDRARLSVAAGKYPEAEADLTEVLRSNPDSASLHFLLSKVHQARGQELRRQQELSDAIRLDPRMVTARIELANSLRNARSAKTALEILDKAPEEQKSGNAFTSERNWVLLALGGHASELRKSIDRGFAKEKTEELFLQDGVLRLQEKDFAGGRKSLEQALAMAPDDARPLDILVQSYVAENKRAAALQTVQKYAAQSSKPEFRYLTGLWQSRLGDDNAARKSYESVLASDANFAAARVRIAEIDARGGRFDQAEQGLESVKSVPGQQAQAELLLAMIDEGKPGDHAAAVVHYRKVLETDPNNLLALNNLAYHLSSDDKQLDQALTYAQHLSSLTPGNPDVQDTIGWIYYRKGLYTTALKFLQGATEKDPSAAHKYHLSMAYAKAGNPDRARQTLEQALKINAGLPEAAMAKAVVLPNVLP